MRTHPSRASLLASLPVLVCALAFYTAVSVSPAAADVTIGLYSDVSGSSCSFAGNDAGPVTAYVVLRPYGSGVRGVRFAAPIPACFGATVISEIVSPGVVAIGDTQNGISIASTPCIDYPAMVLQVTYQSAGTATPCCDFPIVPDPYIGYLEAVDCVFEGTPAVALTSHFNADASCPCVGNSPPLPPTNPSPWNGQFGVSPHTLLTWVGTDYENNITEYDVYLGTTPTPPLVAAGLTQPSYSPSTLAPLTPHYWRVVARDSEGAETSGLVWMFTTREINTPPGIPGPPSPADGATGVGLDVALQWQAYDIDNDPLVFDVYFGTEASPPLVVSSISAMTYTPGGLSYGTAYHWRVVARDPSGAETSSSLWAFTTRSELNSPPLAPSNPSPAHNAFNISLTPNLAWACSDPEGDAITYDVYFGATSPPPLVLTDHASTFYTPGVLAASTTYRWRIVARDSFGAETSGPTWAFTTLGSNLPPSVPSNPDPPNGGYSSSAPTLTWTCTDPNGNPLVFLVFFGTSVPPPVVTVVTSPQYSPGTLVPGEQYFWQIIAYDGQAETTGPIWQFTASGPPLPVLISRFEASAVAGGVEVRWELASDEAVDHFTLYRREGSSTLSTAVTRGPVDEFRQSYLDRAVEGGTTYHYELVVTATDGDEFRSPVATVKTAVLALALYPNHPNPFNPQTTIRYDLPPGASPVRVRLFVLDVAGRVVRTLVDENQRGGTREVTWDGRDDRGGAVSSGVYLSVLDVDGERRTRKMVLLK